MFSMNQIGYFTLLCLLSFTLGSAIPSKEEHKDRVIDQKLSEQEHFDHEEHNAEYDHEAFLGKQEAHEFDDLSPEESKERLGGIFDKIDNKGNGDGKVSQEELKNWIKYVQNKYIIDDTERQWKELSAETSDSKLQWEAYKKKTYGAVEGEEATEDIGYKDMMDRDRRRWERADQDKDGILNKDEYTNFLHPEEAEHMREIIIQETLDDIDKNKDGVISLDEYIGDFMAEDDDGPEPEWVQSERTNFNDTLDTNKDGVMDKAEIRAWIMPVDYDHTTSESEHLMKEADADQDNFLSKEEVLDKYDVFVGSQATDFGEAIRQHDEF